MGDFRRPRGTANTKRQCTGSSTAAALGLKVSRNFVDRGAYRPLLTTLRITKGSTGCPVTTLSLQERQRKRAKARNSFLFEVCGTSQSRGTFNAGGTPELLLIRDSQPKPRRVLQGTRTTCGREKYQNTGVAALHHITFVSCFGTYPLPRVELSADAPIGRQLHPTVRIEPTPAYVGEVPAPNNFDKRGALQ